MVIANRAESAKGNWVKRQPSEISFFFFFFVKPKKSDVLFISFQIYGVNSRVAIILKKCES